jgi:hypothetical protein
MATSIVAASARPVNRQTTRQPRIAHKQYDALPPAERRQRFHRDDIDQQAVDACVPSLDAVYAAAIAVVDNSVDFGLMAPDTCPRVAGSSSQWMQRKTDDEVWQAQFDLYTKTVAIDTRGDIPQQIAKQLRKWSRALERAAKGVEKGGAE